MAQILLVDDDENFRLMLKMTLKAMGHEVSEATNGDKAWAKFNAEPTDLIILDLIMPDKEGLETIQLFRKNRISVKILAISGGGRLNVRDILGVALQFGADAILAKPFSNQELMVVLDRLLAPLK
jgi:DNA-binding response OmpR family regulator